MSSAALDHSVSEPPEDNFITELQVLFKKSNCFDWKKNNYIVFLTRKLLAKEMTVRLHERLILTCHVDAFIFKGGHFVVFCSKRLSETT